MGKARHLCYDQRKFLDAHAGASTSYNGPHGWTSEEQIPSHTCFLLYYPKRIPTDLKCQGEFKGERYELKKRVRSPPALPSQLATVKLPKQQCWKMDPTPGVSSAPSYLLAWSKPRRFPSLPTQHQHRQRGHSVPPFVFSLIFSQKS